MSKLDKLEVDVGTRTVKSHIIDYKVIDKIKTPEEKIKLKPGFNIEKRKSEIEKTKIKIKYNKVSQTIDIGTPDGFYTIQIKLPDNATEDVSGIEKRTSEAFDFVKKYFIDRPEELHKLGYLLMMALINSTGTATAFNIDYVTKGSGGIKYP